MADLNFSNVYTQAFDSSYPYSTSIGTSGRMDPTKGQGNVSNIRHGVGTSLGRDIISQWLDPSSIETGDPNLFARAAGTGGAWLGGAGQEIGDAWRGFRKGTPRWWVQPWEDVLANTMGLRKTDYYTSPETKATNLSNVYATDTGIMNRHLQNLSKDTPGALTQIDLQRRSQPTFERPSANREFTRTDYGKSYQAGGSVNPFEETARAGRAERDTRFGGNLETANIRPREYQPSDNVPDYFKGPYEPDLTREPSEAWELMGSKANQPWQDSGVMRASSGDSWLANNPWFLNFMANRHGDPSQLEALEGMDQGGNGLLGADWDFDIGRGEDDSWNIGLTGKWNTPEWMGG